MMNLYFVCRSVHPPCYRPPIFDQQFILFRESDIFVNSDKCRFLPSLSRDPSLGSSNSFNCDELSVTGRLLHQIIKGYNVKPCNVKYYKLYIYESTHSYIGISNYYLDTPFMKTRKMKKNRVGKEKWKTLIQVWRRTWFQKSPSYFVPRGRLRYCSIFVTPDAFHACLSRTSRTRSLMLLNNRTFNGPDFVGCSWWVVLSAYSILLVSIREKESNFFSAR